MQARSATSRTHQKGRRRDEPEPDSWTPWQAPRRGLLRALVPLSVCLAGCALDPGGQRLSAPLDQDQATHAAAKFLEGSEYAEDYVSALNRLEDGTLVETGRNDCGPIRGPTWTFHVRKPHEGMVYVDAGTGKVACSSLPFMRL